MYLCIYMYVFVYVCMYVFVYVCMFVYVYIYIYIFYFIIIIIIFYFLFYKRDAGSFMDCPSMSAGASTVAATVTQDLILSERIGYGFSNGIYAKNRAEEEALSEG